MKRLSTVLFVAALFLPAPSHAQQEESYDYFRPQREMILHGQQAIFMCNGLFTSNRTLEQVFDKELRYLSQPVGTPRGGDYEVDWERKAVAIGVAGGTPVMRAAFRQGIGCVILAPDQTFQDIADLPIIDTPVLPGDASKMPWPEGDWVADKTLPSNLDPVALLSKPEQIRTAVAEVLEAYGPGTGHIFNLGHGITPDVPPEHAAAMFEAVRELSPSYHEHA